MVHITVSVDIPSPVEQVWRETADLTSHADWMAEAESIEFLTEQRAGVGTQMLVATKIGPFRTMDVMEVTEWVEGKTIGVRHHGLITGEGAFALEETPHGTRFTWSERLLFPWYFGGPAVALAARPILGRIWRRNLERFSRAFASASVKPSRQLGKDYPTHHPRRQRAIDP